VGTVSSSAEHAQDLVERGATFVSLGADAGYLRAGATKDRAADGAPPGCLPWFNVPGRRTARDVIAFGHWSALGWLSRPDVMGLDTGCVWGGCLSAVRLGANAQERELIQVRCERPRTFGADIVA
jgi:bis(5'-nucleosyl)-tetraphosphatase (symmetrical)